MLSALRFLGCNPTISSDPDEIASADTLLLPGVGSLLDGGEARLQELAGAGGVATVELEDSAADLFHGLNTPAEYDTLRSSLGEDGA